MYGPIDEEDELAKRELTSLDIEKRAYFWITVTLAIISALGSIVSTLTDGYSFRWLLSDLFWEAIDIALLAFVLFSSELWAKACCAGLVVLEVLMICGVSFLVMPMITGIISSSSILPNFIIVPLWVTIATNLLWAGWLLYILWRDYKNLNPA